MANASRIARAYVRRTMIVWTSLARTSDVKYIPQGGTYVLWHTRQRCHVN